MPTFYLLKGEYTSMISITIIIIFYSYCLLWGLGVGGSGYNPWDLGFTNILENGDFKRPLCLCPDLFPGS